jgi:hypothetical protein
VHVTTEGKDNVIKEQFYEEREQVFEYFPTYKIKVNFSLCFNLELRHDNYWESEGMAPRIT